jgi:WD40 repeat protein
MDSFNILDYVDNSFTESKRANTLDHYYSVAKRTLVTNDVSEMNQCEGIFSNNDLTLHICFIAKACNIFIRNFELHQVTRRIDLQSLPLQLALTPHSSFFLVLQRDCVLKMVDMVNLDNTSQIETIHEEVAVMKMCPNGRYVITGGNKGDVCVWNIKRREIMSHEQLMEMGLLPGK